MECNRKRRYKKKVKVQSLKKKRFEEYSETENNLTDTASVDIQIDHESNSTDIPPSDSNLMSDNSIRDSHSVCEVTNEIPTCNSSSSDEEFVYDKIDATEIRELQEWVVSTNVPHDHVDKLLKILRRRLLPSLPRCTKTLLKCDVDLNNIEKMTVSNGSEGEFKYFGLKDQ